jgi:hypothetical protein
VSSAVSAPRHISVNTGKSGKTIVRTHPFPIQDWGKTGPRLAGHRTASLPVLSRLVPVLVNGNTAYVLQTWQTLQFFGANEIEHAL